MTGCGGDPPASKGDLISITPTEGPLGCGHQVDRGCGVTGSGKSPIKNPGKNWAVSPGFGDVEEPSIIGSDSNEGTWGSTAKAVIAVTTTLSSGPGRKTRPSLGFKVYFVRYEYCYPSFFPFA